jgi:hypothetical protein
MTAGEMHYDYKQKLNKIDSQKNRNLKVPEIDWKLNEAQDLFVKIVAQPRTARRYGFETSQRTIDDIRTVVKDQKPSEYIIPTVFNNSSFTVALPQDYWFLVNLNIFATKGSCVDILMYNSTESQHDDRTEVSPFNSSNFEWRTANYNYNKEGIRIFTDKTFTITKVGFEYITELDRIHNAKDFEGGTYQTIDGVPLTGSQDCKLPRKVHSEVVDLAVILTAIDLNLPEYKNKLNKLNLTS